MRTIDLRGVSARDAAALVPRAVEARENALKVAGELVADVRDRGEAALREHAERFDGVSGHPLRVPRSDIDAAVASLDPAVRDALEQAIVRVRRASAAQVPAPAVTELAPGARVTQRWQPVRRVGVYVPGGKAVYPSTVVMNVVPAQVAGVEAVALMSPAQRPDGSVHPTILAAAGILGVEEVYAIGGASAISALAHGVDEIGLEAVDVVTGPGNNFVAAAKRHVAGMVGIDSEAGATEILVIADATADPVVVAADLVSQAEHDEQAGSVLVTDSPELARAVERETERLAARTLHSTRVKAALQGSQSAIVIVDDLAAAADFSNAYAPEHLEVVTAEPEDLLPRLTSAGAIFLGASTPVSLGDYLAGSNHVLPTGGQARYAAGLGAHTFLRPQQVISYDRAALAEVAGPIIALAEAEALPAHGEAITARFSPERLAGGSAIDAASTD
ncbi:histidinol dehydrogenase [Microbacterium sp. NPDC078428]|uniref:histidinol dehydrogenase n=1 Tax=Microbacterium sp. NPDC078428 TaxID=3364190 RepID=UPI0037C8A0A5